jgi:hypothetical protein
MQIIGAEHYRQEGSGARLAQVNFDAALTLHLTRQPEIARFGLQAACGGREA